MSNPCPQLVARSLSLLSFPVEIIENIAVFSADSGGHSVALKLCVICNVFYKSAIKRLYHTIDVDEIEKLDSLLRTSALQKPWVAACVRVLLLPLYFYIGIFLHAPVTRALKEFTGLISFRCPAGVTLDSASPLPCLRRLVQAKTGDIPQRIAENLTHLCLHGNLVQLFSQVLEQKSTLGCLTHLLIVSLESSNIIDPATDVLGPIYSHGLSNTLRVFVVAISGTFDHIDDSARRHLGEKVQNGDPRIVLWAPDYWTEPLFLKHNAHSRLKYECLGGLPDGVSGIWEAAEQWILKCKQSGQDTISSCSSENICGRCDQLL
ncbi:hypothetical protein DL96DRAFT_1590507, partial [Flagelloscypha sp. PMI_526]